MGEWNLGLVFGIFYTGSAAATTEKAFGAWVLCKHRYMGVLQGKWYETVLGISRWGLEDLDMAAGKQT